MKIFKSIQIEIAKLDSVIEEQNIILDELLKNQTKRITLSNDAILRCDLISNRMNEIFKKVS